MLKKQLENLLTHLPQQSSYLYFASSCSPQAKTPPSSPRFDHLAFCASLRHRAQRPQETLSTFLNAPLLSMPSSQVWDTAPPRPQQGTKRLRARFGLISGIGPAGLNQDLALNLFQEILLKFPPILPTQCSHGKKVCAYRCIVSVPGKDFAVRLKTKLFPNDNAKVAHQSKLFPAVI